MPKPNVFCKKCSTHFYAKPFFIKKGLGIFCSRACHHEAMKKRINKKCATCQKLVERTPRQTKVSKSNAFFCSKSCQTVWRNKQFIGEKHKLWNGGVDYRKRLERSGRKKECVRCALKDQRLLAVHHIDEDRSNNKLENLIYLCHNCHHLIHRDKVEKRIFEKSLK